MPTTSRQTAQAPLWEQQARQWGRVRPPLRPAGDDVAIVQQVVDDWGREHGRAPCALVLGATAEFAMLRWPAGSRVVAIDLSEGMLRGVWMAAPGSSAGRLAVVGQWLDMPLPDGACDLVLADGSYSLLRQHQSTSLSHVIRRVLRADGLLVLRAYVRPDIDESPHDVWAEMLAGRIGSFHVFKLRLLMSLQHGAGEVRVVDAWKFFHEHSLTVESIARRTGWPIEEVATIDAYRGQPSIYWFPTLAEFRDALDADFVEQSCVSPAYELGHCCPTLRCRPRSDGP